jgi:hypothetical protein
MSRITKHLCPDVVREALSYKKEFAQDHPPGVQRGPFGLGIHGFAEHPHLYPHQDYTQEMKIYIPFASFCPYCGEELAPPVTVE